jgi:hypothetical protein
MKLVDAKAVAASLSRPLSIDVPMWKTMSALTDATMVVPANWVFCIIFAEFEQSNCVKKFNGINWKKSISGDHQWMP